MVNSIYSKAYTEVLEMLKYLPENEYNKIPKEKIDFLKKNKDANYKFSINPEIELEKQNISMEANSIIVTIFRDCFASDLQKEKLNIILNQNENKYQEQLREKYNTDNIFKNRKNTNIINLKIESNNLPVEVKKNNFFEKFVIYIKKIIKRMRK